MSAIRSFFADDGELAVAMAFDGSSFDELEAKMISPSEITSNDS